MTKSKTNQQSSPSWGQETLAGLARRSRTAPRSDTSPPTQSISRNAKPARPFSTYRMRSPLSFTTWYVGRSKPIGADLIRRNVGQTLEEKDPEGRELEYAPVGLQYWDGRWPELVSEEDAKATSYFIEATRDAYAEAKQSGKELRTKMWRVNPSDGSISGQWEREGRGTYDRAGFCISPPLKRGEKILQHTGVYVRKSSTLYPPFWTFGLRAASPLTGLCTNPS